MAPKSESVSSGSPVRVVANSQGLSALDHLALAIEAANNLKTVDILLPVGVAREILSKFQSYTSPPPNPPPITNNSPLSRGVTPPPTCIW
jgi:hypothetical protein